MASSHFMARLSRAFLAHGALVLLLVAIGSWLANDFLRERERIVAEVSRLAMHKSQLISALFADTFIAADYVLHDAADHVDLAVRRKAALGDLTPLLEKKMATVPGLTDLVLLDEDCRFVAMANRKHLLGTKSHQRFCSIQKHESEPNLHIQYMPAEKSANGKPVVLMSRLVVSPQGVMLAAAMAVIELDYAQRWIEAFAVDTYDVQTILDTDGVVIARNPKLPGDLGTRTLAPADQPAFDNVRGTISFTARSPLDNRERIFGLTQLERFPFITLVGYDKPRALAGWKLRVWQFVLCYLALVVLSIAFLRAYLQTVAQSRTLHALATSDALTGIANRRHLFNRGAREVSRAMRYDKPLAVLMIDVDLFKQINDRWGHPSGDRVIRDVADLLGSVLRSVDIFGRLGGEEFTAILPETDRSGGVILAERLRQAIEASEAVSADDGETIRYTVSIGVATLLPGDAMFDTLMQRADRALYQAKASGRNRVVAD